VDIFSPAQRSRIMASIRSKNTGPEKALFALARPLWKTFRYRKHARGLPGTPDLAFPSAKVAVFVDGDFWHGKIPAARIRKLPKFWRQKIARNMARDRRTDRALRAMGWRVVHIRETRIKKKPAVQLGRIMRALGAGS